MASNTNTTPKIKLGQIEEINIPDVFGLEEALENIPDPTPPYAHPTQDPIDSGSLVGAQVLSRIVVNNLGHTESIAIRNLTPTNIGAQPAGSYETTANKSNNSSLGTSSTLYPSQKAVKTYVDNAVSPKADSAITLTAGDGLSGGGNLTANRSFAVDATVLRTNNTSQTKTGYFRLMRGLSSGESNMQGWDYPDNNGEDYNFRLKNNGSGNNVNYYFTQKSIAGSNDVTLDYAVLGFRNGIVSIGSSEYATPDLEIEDYYNTQSTPAVRHPLRLYVDGQSQFKEAIVVGTTLKKSHLFAADTTIYNEGSIVLGTSSSNVYRTISLNTPDSSNAYIGMPNYSAFNIYNARVSNGHYFKSNGLDLFSISGNGIATIEPGGSPGSLGPSIKFGTATANASNTVDAIIRIQIGNTQYDLLAREVI